MGKKIHAATTEEDMAIEVTTDLSDTLPDGDTMWAAVQS
jgi:hypothetical protein